MTERRMEIWRSDSWPNGHHGSKQLFSRLIVSSGDSASSSSRASTLRGGNTSDSPRSSGCRCIHELELIVARLPNRVFTDFWLTTWAYGDLKVVSFQNMIWVPALYLNNQQPYARNDHKLLRRAAAGGAQTPSSRRARAARKAVSFPPCAFPSRGYFFYIAKDLGGCPKCARAPPSRRHCRHRARAWLQKDPQRSPRSFATSRIWPSRSTAPW